jgi:hypothetical protein
MDPFLSPARYDAVYDSVTVDAVSAGYIFRTTHTAINLPVSRPYTTKAATTRRRRTHLRCRTSR